MPKYMFGRPADQVGETLLDLRVPLSARRSIASVLYNMAVGDLSRFGVPRPDHRLFETHPIVNSQMPYYLSHGDIAYKPDIAAYHDDAVAFVDGTREPIDLIIYATGFRIVFPFMDERLLNWRQGYPSLFLNVFHPAYDNLFVIGLIQPDSGQWGLADLQAQLVAHYIHCLESAPARADRLRALKQRGQERYSGGVRYKESTRHFVEIEHHSYRRRLRRLLRQLTG